MALVVEEFEDRAAQGDADLSRIVVKAGGQTQGVDCRLGRTLGDADVGRQAQARLARQTRWQA